MLSKGGLVSLELKQFLHVQPTRFFLASVDTFKNCISAGYKILTSLLCEMES